MTQLSLFDRTSVPARTVAPARTKIAGLRETGRPLLFLDFDGVISRDPQHPQEAAANRLRRPCVAVLNTIVARTGCLVVVSSMWRYNPQTNAGLKVPELQACLENAGFTGEVVGVTKYIPGDGNRGLEVQAWLEEMDVAPGTKIAILDDWQPMGKLSHRLVMTNYEAGLTPVKAEAVIKLLGTR